MRQRCVPPRHLSPPLRLPILGALACALVFVFAVLLMFDGSIDLAALSVISGLRSSIPAAVGDDLWLVSKVLEKSTGAAANFVLAAGVGMYIAITRRDWRPGGLLIGTVLGVLAATRVLKGVFDRPAPLEWSLGEPTGRAFPSGHAAQALAVWGLLAFLWYREHTGAASFLMPIALGASVAMMGIARLVLNAHWWTDVVAGWALGGFVLCVALALAHRLRGYAPLDPRRPAKDRMCQPAPASRSRLARRSS